MAGGRKSLRGRAGLEPIRRIQIDLNNSNGWWQPLQNRIALQAVEPNSLRTIVFTEWQYGLSTGARRRSGTRSSDSTRAGGAMPYAASFAFASSEIQSV